MLSSRPTVSRCLLVACTALALGASPGARAQCADELARKVFEAGHAFYEAGDYAEALRSFQRSYELCPKAEQLKNIGATHERMGDLAAAISAYEKYQRAVDSAEERESTAVRIANLKKRLTPAPSSATASATAAPVVAPTAPETAANPAPRGPSRTVAVAVLGVSGAVAVGSLITGLVARSRFNEAEKDCGKSCDGATVDRINQMAWLSTGLTGLAVLGAGVGGYLFYRSSPEPARPGLQGVNASVGPGAARLGASWAF